MNAIPAGRTAGAPAPSLELSLAQCSAALADRRHSVAHSPKPRSRSLHGATPETSDLHAKFGGGQPSRYHPIMASHGGDDGGRWGASPTTEPVGSAYLSEDDPVTIRNDPPNPLGRSTDKNWDPSGDGPKTRPRDHGAPLAIFDGPTSGDDDANVTQRRYAIRERHGTMPMDQVLVPSGEPPPPAPTPETQPPTPKVMPPPMPSAPAPPAGDVLPNPLQPRHLQGQSVTTLASETDPPAGPWTPPPAFSDRPPWEEAEPAPKPRGPLIALAAVGALLLAGGAFALGWLVKPSPTETQAGPAAPDPNPTSGSAPAAPTGSASTPTPEPPLEGTSDESVDDTSTPSPSGHTSASPRRANEPSETELARLLSYEGYLTVTSTADAEVYVQGKHVGRTNERLVSKCYQRFVRLKKGTNGPWITPGRPVRIACMSSTTVEINPE